MRSDGRPRALRALLAVTALSLAVRLAGLGARVFHWDEGRVGYWILRYHETGQFSYRPIVHGPFLFVVNDWVFALLPPTDFSARLVVAVVGGLLPLSAWLLRDRLTDAEVIALGLVLAVNPLLVYYSRFMRNDLLVGAFVFVAVALLVRALDRGDARLVPLAAAAFGLAFTTKENAVVYLLCLLGAGALLVDHRLFRAARAGRSVPRLLRREWPQDVRYRLVTWGGSVPRGVGRCLAHLAGAVVVFLTVIGFFYAPRPELWEALGRPARLPGVFEAATLGSWESFYDLWVAGSHQDHDYLPFLYDYLETLLYGAPFVLLFAVVGFVADGYGSIGVGPDAGGSRSLVAVATYWGVVSVLGYPVATDIRAPWAAVHAVVPLAIPAAVGIAVATKRVSRAISSASDGAGVDERGPLLRPAAWTIPAFLAALILSGAAVGVVAANATYTNSASEAEAGEVIQWAQPGNDLKRTLALVERVSRDNEGVDVLFVGTHPPGDPDDVHFHVENESSLRQPRAGGPSWHSRLPLPWYLERYGATVASTPPDATTIGTDPPPVVVAADWDEAAVERELPGYERHRHDFRLWNDEIVIFVDEDAAERARDRGKAGASRVRRLRPSPTPEP